MTISGSAIMPLKMCINPSQGVVYILNNTEALELCSTHPQHSSVIVRSQGGWEGVVGRKERALEDGHRTQEQTQGTVTNISEHY